MTEFPILSSARLPGGPISIPFTAIEKHREQASANHGGQTLERLAERGGLSWCELLAVLENRHWQSLPPNEAMQRVMRRISGAAEAPEEQPEYECAGYLVSARTDKGSRWRSKFFSYGDDAERCLKQWREQFEFVGRLGGSYEVETVYVKREKQP